MQSKITINLNILTLDRLFPGGVKAVIDKARAIEDANIDGIVMPDHVVFGSNVTYPFGGWPVNPADTWPEPMTVLAAAAAVTQKVALLTNVLIAPLRPAPVLAKQVATLHQLSGGRFQLGVGTGWQKEEYAACGFDFAQRSEVLFEQMQACHSLWYEQPAHFNGRHVRFDETWCSPGLHHLPDEQRMPLWFGIAPTAANARFFAQFDAGWSCINPDPDFIARGRDSLQTALREQFGITRPLRIRAAPYIACDETGHASVEHTLQNLPRSIAAGVTDFDFPMLFFVPDAARFDTVIQALGRIDRRIDHHIGR